MKMGGYAGIDPTHSSGGTTPSQLEREVFREFLDDQAGMHLEALQTREDLGLAPSLNRWWLEQPQERYWLELTDREDLGSDLRAPRYSRDGSELWRYTLLLEIRPGDTVYHYHKDAQAIVARSTVDSWARDQSVIWAARGTYAREAGAEPHEREGLIVELSDFERLDRSVSLEQLRDQLERLEEVENRLSQHHSGALYLPFAIRSDGGVRPNQGYAFKFPAAYHNLFPELEGETDREILVRAQDRSKEGDSSEQAKNSSYSSGQGFANTHEVRQAIEDASMSAAVKFFKQHGFEVQDKSATSPFDLFCESEDDELYVEVKGTRGDGSKVLLTRGEVNHARDHSESMVLFVLKNLEIDEQDDNLVAAEGDREVIWPWRVDQGTLDPIKFSYELP